jgi:hypothetical protein
MRSRLSLLISSALIASSGSAAPLCSEVHKAVLQREEVQEIVAQLQQPLRPGEIGVRLLSNAPFDVADPARPLEITLPNGKNKVVIGLSGQNLMMSDSWEDLVRGGLQKIYKIDLYNEFGHKYGGETDPQTGQAIGYAFDSSTWDTSLIRIRNADGSLSYKVLAGAMANDSSGRPLLITKGSNTRERKIFDAEFKEIPEGSGEFRLVATNPHSLFNKGLPKDGNWVEVDAKGHFIFNHGYGGEPVTLLNGDLFVDERGWVPVAIDTVWEQKVVADSSAPGGLRKTPYRTVIAVGYMDQTLSEVKQAPQIIFDVYKQNGSVFKAAERPFYGPLAEGPRITIKSLGRALRSMAEVIFMRAQGKSIDAEMLLSAGEYYAKYGSFMANSKKDLHSFKPLKLSDGELDDLTSELAPLFTWEGRPVSFYVGRQEYLLIHGVSRASIPRGIPLDVKIDDPKQFKEFHRQVILVPVMRRKQNGFDKIYIKDNTGLLQKLAQFRPLKTS